MSPIPVTHQDLLISIAGKNKMIGNLFKWVFDNSKGWQSECYDDDFSIGRQFSWR